MREPAVLIVDDDESFRITARWSIATLGCEVDVADSGAHAISEAHSHQFAVCFVDLRLPDMSGTDVIRTLKESHPSSQCFLISGFLTIADTVEAMKAGAIDVIEKPIEMDALVATTAEALSARSRTVETLVECSGRELISLNSPAARFAGYVLKACESHEDLKTVVAWAKFVGVSYPALSELCRLLRITPHDGRDFMRLLRATRLAEQSRLRIETFLDISDRRTLQRLLNRAGLAEASISVEAFTQRQSFIPHDAEAFQAVLAGIVKRSGSSKPN